MIGRLRQRWSDEPSGWKRATWIFVGIGAAVLLALAVSGLFLTWRYRPTVDEAFPGMNIRTGEQGVRTLHRALSTVLFWTGIGLVFTGLGRAVERHQAGDGRGAVIATGALAVAVVVLVVAASFTGYLLAWDQLALSAVTVGGGTSGIWTAAFGDGIAFVLIDGTEVSQSTFAGWSILHVIGPLVAVVVGALVIRRRVQRAAATG